MSIEYGLLRCDQREQRPGESLVGAKLDRALRLEFFERHRQERPHLPFVLLDVDEVVIGEDGRQRALKVGG